MYDPFPESSGGILVGEESCETSFWFAHLLLLLRARPLEVKGGLFSCCQVRFSRPESEQARQRRVQSYEFLQKRQAEEHWAHLHYYGVRVGAWFILQTTRLLQVLPPLRPFRESTGSHGSCSH